ncbi:RNA polymerase factor sigma-32 [bacterium]|nr:RNA polymerase factor sigma-32 [bacterium]
MKNQLVKLDSLKKYLQEIQKYPFLTKEEELELAQRYRETGDLEAARRLVTSHLRLVAKIALEYRVAYHNVLDLVQEGTVGLMQAVRKFDPDRGTRLSTYATWWIKSYILKFILDNFRLIKIGTTKNQQKLFYNLMEEKRKIESMGYYAGPKQLAERLGVSEAEVIEMDKRLSEPELAIDQPIGGSHEVMLKEFLPIDESGPEVQVQEQQSENILKEKFEVFAKDLNDRELKIFRERLLSDLPRTLQDIADEYYITKERVRQLEARIVGNLKKYFEEAGITIDTI